MPARLAAQAVELIEDGHERLSHDIFRDEEMPPAVQEEPIAFERRDMFAHNPSQCFGAPAKPLGCWWFSKSGVCPAAPNDAR